MMSTTSTELLGEKTRQRVVVMDYSADVDYCDADDSSRELMVCRRRCRLLMLTDRRGCGCETFDDHTRLEID